MYANQYYGAAAYADLAMSAPYANPYFDPYLAGPALAAMPRYASTVPGVMPMYGNALNRYGYRPYGGGGLFGLGMRRWRGRGLRCCKVILHAATEPLELMPATAVW